MTDKQKLLELLNKISIEYREIPAALGGNVGAEVYSFVQIENSLDEGYGGFFSSWNFDINDNLISIGHFE